MNMFPYISVKHTDPAYKALRKSLADYYRNSRKGNRPLANLVWKYNRDAERALVDQILYGVSYSRIYPMDIYIK